ncbi:MAG: hypothetical protein LBC96_00480 [Lachnospiraceae bacterium]|jgi:hypothetical protein|nr:hypothetical protein [Lachnospiraceae bacterium]
MRRNICLLLICSFFLSSCTTTGGSGDRPVSNTIVVAYQRATDIVKVEVLDDGRVETINSKLFSFNYNDIETEDNFYIIYQVQVIESFYGDKVAGDIIDVGQVINEISNDCDKSEYIIPFKEGDYLVLFLSWFDHYSEIAPARLTSQWASVYRYTPKVWKISGKTKSDIRHILENMDERNDFTLTVGELRDERITERRINYYKGRSIKIDWLCYNVYFHL